MSEPKFIPGPWEWRKPYDTACYFQLVAIGDYGTHPNGDKVYPVIADDGSAGDEYSPTIDATGPEAQLIAAAPDLYAACKAALNRLIDLGAEDDKDLLGPCEATELVRSALAKVEGKL